MKVSIVLMILIIHGSCFIDYNSEHILVCQNINMNFNYTQSLQSLWNSVILHAIDRIMFLVCTPILLLIEVLFICVFIKYRQSLFRRQGTIFFSIILIQTTLHACYFIYALYVTINPYGQPMPSSFPVLCGVLGVFNEASDMALDIYLFYFIIYTFLNMRTSIKAKPIFNHKVLHSSAIIVSVCWVIFMGLDDRLAINQFGMCGFSNLRYNTIQWLFPIAAITINLFYIAFALYTYYYFKKHMPLNQTLVKRVYHENKSISYFVAVYSILIMLFNASIGVVYFNCFRDNPLPSLLTFATMMNFTRILQGIFLVYFVMADQTIKKKTKKFIRSFFGPARTQSDASVLQIKDIDFSLPDYENLDITLKQKILQLKEEEHQIDLYKIAQIATIISGICVCHIEYFNTKTFTTSIRKLHFKEKITFQIEPKTLSDYGIEAHKLPKGDILKGTISMIAPRIFSQLLQTDCFNFVEKSFDLSKNYHKMYNIAEGKGGKSGQFFFFSYDYKYVLKTVTKAEYNFIAENLEEFYEYYKKNPQTLLAKIYGLYTIRGEDIGREYDLILMKNLSGCQKKYVIRTYDIKGSKYDREVIKQKDIQNQLESLTLKDTDFLKLERKIYIPRDKVNKLRAILRKDTMFLKNFNLIDYSLLIIRIKEPKEKDPEKEGFWSEYQRIQSSLHENQYYHIGIIDYMQAWNISKKSQNWFKGLLGKTEISSQEPNFYQRRFMQFVQEITYYTNYNKEESSRFDCSDYKNGFDNFQTDSKTTSIKLNLKSLQMSLQSPRFNKIQKRNFHNNNDHQFMMPHDISEIMEKDSVKNHDISGQSLIANFVNKTQSFRSLKKLDEKILPNRTQSFNSDSQKLVRKNALFTFKNFNLNKLVVNELHQVAESNEINEGQSRVSYPLPQ